MPGHDGHQDAKYSAENEILIPLDSYLARKANPSVQSFVEYALTNLPATICKAVRLNETAEADSSKGSRLLNFLVTWQHIERCKFGQK